MSQRNKKRGRRRGHEPQDEAEAAYVRYLALGRWEEIQEVWQTNLQGAPQEDALQELSAFLERGAYAPIWQRHWTERVVPTLASRDPGAILGALEAAIGASLQEEEEERLRRGDISAFEERDFLVFMEQSLGRLFQDAWGEIDKG